MDEKILIDLKSQLRGELILLGDERYDKDRSYNAMIGKRPARRSK